MITEKLTETNSIQLTYNNTASNSQEDISFPLTEAQKEIWLASQLNEAASCAYNETVTLTFEGILQEDHLRQAIRAILTRHDVFHFHISKEGIMHQHNEPLQYSLSTYDLSSLPEEEQQHALDAFYKKESLTPFALEQAPLIRSTLIKIAKTTHILVCTAHHLIVDGWSQQLLINELGTIYTALCTHTGDSLPEPATYAAYAAKKEAQLQSSQVEKARTYWRQQFASLPPVMELPADRRRPSTRSFRGQTLSERWDADFSAQIKQAARSCNVTLHGFLLSAYYVLLNRLSGQKDLVIGIPAAGQPLAGQLQLIGHCVNLLPLRLTLKQESSFKELLHYTKNMLLDAYDYPELSFGNILNMLHIKRDSSRLPLVETLFNVSVDLNKTGFHELTTTIAKAPKYATNFDLYLNIIDDRDSITLDCDYNSDVFDHATITRWCNHYRQLLTAVVADPEKEISSISLLSAEEKELILHTWNATASAYPKECSLPQLFETQVRETPQQTALIFKDTSLTYHELNIQVNQLAHRLRSLGIGPGRTAGIHLDRCTEMLIAVLAVLKAGGAYIPMDPEFPEQRLRHILENSGSTILLTKEHIAASFTAHAATHNIEVLFLDKDHASLMQEKTTNPEIVTRAEDLASILYTSGSSGNPKGVQIRHCSLINFLYAMKKEPGMTADDRMLALTTLSFDIAGLELFLPLLTGASLVIAPRETTLDPRLLQETLKKKEITIMQATPATWQMLLDTGWHEAPRLKALCGGEALSMQLANAIRATGAELWNLYGPTETTIWSTIQHIEQECVTAPSIGKPIANTHCYIVDAHHQPVPIGVTGELLIGGDGLAAGYFGLDALTKEKFIPDHFTAQKDRYLYRTGDLARYLPNGEIEFRGRTDFQVKIRGFRIETGEIETALLKHPEINKAAVIAREDTPGKKQLVAYLVTENQSLIKTEQVRTFLQECIPHYMIPSAYVVLDRFPLTPNGKVDRNSFPLPSHTAAMSKTEYSAPTNPIEKQIAEIWQQVLQLPRVGVHDNFFDLGGHSLLLAQVHRMLQTDTNLKLSMIRLFQYPTIASLAAHLTSADTQASSHRKIKDRVSMQKRAMDRQKQIKKARGKKDE